MYFSSTCKYRTGFCSLRTVRIAQCEKFINVIRFEKASLFRIFQHSIGEKLFEDLPVENIQKCPISFFLISFTIHPSPTFPV